MDALGHNCLKEGTKASKAKAYFHRHLDIDHLEEILVKQRKENPTKSILVVTESLFSMDSDCPDLDRIQKLSKKPKIFSSPKLFQEKDQKKAQISKSLIAPKLE